MGVAYDLANMSHHLYHLLWRTEVVLACAIMPLLLLMAAPYGRHHRRGWGPSVNSRWAWLFMELPAVMVIAAVYAWACEQASHSLSWIYLAVWEIHYIYRTFIYPLLLRGARKNFPLLLMLFAVAFNTMNGFINGYALFVLRPSVTTSHLLRFQSLLGLGVFTGGLALNISSDAIIRALRRSARDATDGPRYAIPYGGGFRYVSNPHYLGEIIEWMGWAIFTRTQAGWAFALFTFANLMPRAVANHRWYRATFPDYPLERRILIPFLF